ncbi:MAG: tRNA lysidine(34) synthetase TilS [Candidatus Eremiobacteraeota bacterium]|nr:tRNA lysidine(34) synthetase TilS [Candidatus Eremiobacteraeota bacterium]
MRGAKPQRALESALVRDATLRNGESILIACSGGPDSVALAAAMNAVATKQGWRLSIAHINHGQRRSADQDEAVVLHVAAALGLPVASVRLSAVPRGEGAMRTARYATLQRIAEKREATAIATGHTAEDQTETVLMALFRGAGTAGLTGIAARRPLAIGIDLYRPLLRRTHDELRHYCEMLCLPYALDPTNEDVRYRRNAVREALTTLRLSFPRLDRAVARAAHIVADELADAPRATLRRRVREALDESGELLDVDFEHIESAVRALEAGRSGLFHAKRNVSVSVRRGRLGVKKR